MGLVNNTNDIPSDSTELLRFSSLCIMMIYKLQWKTKGLPVHSSLLYDGEGLTSSNRIMSSKAMVEYVPHGQQNVG